MTEDEKYARENWERAELCPCPFNGLFNTSLGGLRFTRSNPGEEDTPEQAWAVAAEFTRERREQIRQLEREVLVIGNLVHMYARDAKRCIDGTCSTLSMGLEGSWAMCAYTVGRTLARLESALADLCLGMKQPAEPKSP